MVNGNDIVEFEEKHWEKLFDDFKNEHADEWEEFVLKKFNEYNIEAVDLNGI